MPEQLHIYAHILKLLRQANGKVVSRDDISTQLSQIGLQAERSTQVGQPFEFFAMGLTPGAAGAYVRQRSLQELVDNYISDLSKAQLITVHADGVALADHFAMLQSVLGISLTELSNRKNNTIPVAPVFSSPRVFPIEVFVIMPFVAQLDCVFSEIKICCAARNLAVTRADEQFGAAHVIDDIWSALFSAKAIVADCTGKNPNVLYELGIAHVLGKPILMITQSEEDVPFDLKHWRYCVYKSDCSNLKPHINKWLHVTFR